MFAEFHRYCIARPQSTHQVFVCYHRGRSLSYIQLFVLSLKNLLFLLLAKLESGVILWQTTRASLSVVAKSMADSLISPPPQHQTPISNGTLAVSSSLVTTGSGNSDDSDTEQTINFIAELKGYLSKWTNYIHGWQPRFIVLQNGNLSYYKSEVDSDYGCRGAISLHKATIKVQLICIHFFFIKGLTTVYLFYLCLLALKGIQKSDYNILLMVGDWMGQGRWWKHFLIHITFLMTATPIDNGP